MACSGLTNVTLTIVACGRVYFFSSQPPGTAGSDRSEDAVLMVTRSLHAWQWPAWWYSTSPSFLQKIPCGLESWDHGTCRNEWWWWMGPSCTLQRWQEQAGSARQLATQKSFSFPFLLKPLQAGLNNAPFFFFFFNSKLFNYFFNLQATQKPCGSLLSPLFYCKKIYLLPNQKELCLSKLCSLLICKGMLFKDVTISSLSVNRIWAIFQLIYLFYSGTTY